MKKFYIFVITSLTFGLLQAQYYCGSARYDTEVFTTVDTTNNVIFGSSITVSSSTQILRMNIYEPMSDTAIKRPLIIFAHGGSFLGGNKTDADQVALCTRFAKRGYVCATIDYRVGWGFPIDSVNGTRAVVRATQDMKAAVRFFRKDAYTTNIFKIDTNYIFAGGTSAGAFMGIHLAYLNQASEVPAWVNIASLGGLEGNSGNPGYLSTIHGVINLCGALGDSSWIVPGDVPMVSLHGNNDNTVPYCKETIVVLGFPIMVVNGSSPLNVRCNNLGITNPFYTWYNQDHVPYASNALYMDTTVWFVSNFLYSQLGCTASNPNPLPNVPVACAPSGISELNSHLQFEIYPNPSNGIFSISITEDFGSGSVKIYDVTGKEIDGFVFSSKELQFDKSLNPGIYFLRLSVDEKSRTEKIVIY